MSVNSLNGVSVWRGADGLRSGWAILLFLAVSYTVAIVLIGIVYLTDHSFFGDTAAVRGSIALALGDIGPVAKGVVPALLGLLKDRSWFVRSNAVDALQRCGKVAVPSLVEALEDSDPHVRTTAAGALGDIGAEAVAAVPALLKALKDRHADVRREAAGALRPLVPVRRRPQLDEDTVEADSRVDLRRKRLGIFNQRLERRGDEGVAPGLRAFQRPRETAQVGKVRGNVAGDGHAFS